MARKYSSIRTQIYLLLSFTLLLGTFGDAWVTVKETQIFLTQQLTSHAQDTATSLGMSLSEPLLNEDQAVVEATINAIYDRGFYQKITLENVDGTISYQRLLANKPQNVPDWFVNWFEIEVPEQQFQIDTGSPIGGVLKVQSHAGLAYAASWKSAKNKLLLLLMVLFFILFIAYFLVERIYKPIRDISRQAEALQNNKFVIIEKLPNAPELKSFVVAMNKMVKNTRKRFEELTNSLAQEHKENYLDQQTGLANRRSFMDVLNVLLAKSAIHNGYLVMVRISGLDNLNKQQGYQAGDNLVNQLIEQISLTNAMLDKIELYRISGSELCMLINDYPEAKIREHIEQLNRNINNNIEMQNYVSISFGIIYFSSGDDPKQLLYQLDLATNNSIVSDGAFYITNIQAIHSNISINSATDLKKVLDAILLNPVSHLKLLGQSLKALNDERAFDLEIFTAFTYQDQNINTGNIFAIASQYHKTGELDAAITKQVLSLIKKEKNNKLKVSINLSRLTFTNEASIHNIVQLIQIAKVGNQIVIGLTESSILGDLTTSEKHIKLLRNAGCQICITRFGTSVDSLHYLLELSPEFIKLSPFFTRNIEKKRNNIKLVSDFTRLAHGLNVLVLAQQIETEGELNQLNKLNVDGALGYFISKPQNIDGSK